MVFQFFGPKRTSEIVGLLRAIFSFKCTKLILQRQNLVIWTLESLGTNGTSWGEGKISLIPSTHALLSYETSETHSVKLEAVSLVLRAWAEFRWNNMPPYMHRLSWIPYIWPDEKRFLYITLLTLDKIFKTPFMSILFQFSQLDRSDLSFPGGIFCPKKYLFRR